MGVDECTKIVRTEIPTLDEDLSQYIQSKFKTKLFQNQHKFTNNVYISGVLETSYEDFESGEDVYEAIGGVLHEVASDKTEDDIK